MKDFRDNFYSMKFIIYVNSKFLVNFRRFNNKNIVIMLDIEIMNTYNNILTPWITDPVGYYEAVR